MSKIYSLSSHTGSEKTPVVILERSTIRAVNRLAAVPASNYLDHMRNR